MPSRRMPWTIFGTVVLIAGLAAPALLRADEFSDALDRGRELHRAARYDDAIEAYSRAAHSSERQTAREATYQIATCYLSKHEPENALLFFNRAIQIDPSYVAAYEQASNIYLRNFGDYKNALAALLGAEKAFSDTPGSYFNIACCYGHAGNAALAVQYIDKALLYGFSGYRLIGSDPDFAPVRDLEPYRNLRSHLLDVRAAIRAVEEADRQYSKKNLDESERLYREALESYGRALGPDNVAGSWPLRRLGDIAVDRTRYSEALELYNRAIQIQAALLGPIHPAVSALWTDIGLVYDALGDYDRAITCMSEALDIDLETRGDTHSSVATSYNNLGMVYGKRGRYEEAMRNYEKAVAIDSKLLSADDPKFARYYNNMGLASDGMGDYDRAMEYYQKAAEITARSSGPAAPDLANIYNNMGYAATNRRDFDRAVGYYERALEVVSANHSLDHPQAALIFLNLGGAYSEKGEYDRAIGYFEQSLAIDLRTYGPTHPEVAMNYSGMGLVYVHQGNYDRAIEMYGKALDIGTRSLGPDHPQIAVAYNNLGMAYQGKGDFDQAATAYERAISINVKSGSGDHRLLVNMYNNLGFSYYSAGKIATALDCYAKALSASRSYFGGENPTTAYVLNNIGMVHYRQNNFEQAAESYGRALEIALKSADRTIAVTSAQNLGRSEFALGHFEEARGALEAGIGVVERSRSETGAAKAELAGRYLLLYYLLLQAAARTDNMNGVFEAAEKMRARGFLDRLSLAAALSVEGVPDQTRARMLALNDELERLAAQRTAEIGRSSAEQDRDRLLFVVRTLQEREQEFENLDSSLMDIPAYRELRRPEIASLGDAQSMLSPDEAILEYVLWEDETESLAWCLLIRREKVRLVQLETGFDYSETVTRFRNAILDGSLQREESGSALYRKLIEPVGSELQGVTRLIVVPDGSLAFLPFDALRDGPRSPYLAQKYAITLAPSISVLRMVRNRRYGGRPNTLLAFGGARYSNDESTALRSRGATAPAESARASSRAYYAARGATGYFRALGIDWQDLPGTREEVTAIEQELSGKPGVSALLGEGASELTVKRLSGEGRLAAARYLHFACHGRYDAEYPAYSAVVFSEVSGALAGQSTEDGYLTVEEVAQLRLQADVVNLSACETALGKVVRGDGVVGLTRSFMVAGANSVGATLWVVDDQATREFMVRVYQLVETENLGFAQAAAKVKREFLNSGEYSDPYYWSPFVVYGG
ncbi:tetratricopeptide repeat protein [Salinispira pacifica]